MPLLYREKGLASQLAARFALGLGAVMLARPMLVPPTARDRPGHGRAGGLAGAHGRGAGPGSRRRSPGGGTNRGQRHLGARRGAQ